MKPWIGTLLAAGALAGAAEAGDRLERGWALVREDLVLTVEPEAGRLYLEGEAWLRLERADESPGPLLGMNGRDPLMRFVAVEADGAEVELGVTIEELPEATFARVGFPEPRRRGDEVRVRFEAELVAQGRQLVVGPDLALASWVELWYPIAPGQEVESGASVSRVAGTTTFDLPAGWHAVTNGGLVESRVEGDRRIEVWRTDTPLSRSFAAGPYAVTRERVGERDVALYLLSDDLPDPGAHVAALATSMAAMEARLGPYPYPSYAIAEVPEQVGQFGASSEQGFILVKPSFLDVPGGNLPLFAHEAAHAWWGNTVGADGGPGSLLCTESLAQYGAVIAAEAAWGPSGATELLRYSRPGYVLAQSAHGYFRHHFGERDQPLSGLVSGEPGDHDLSDAKGHWVYHMLRRRVGDEVFFATLRGLIDGWTGRKLGLDDVRAAFVAAAPEAGLERFFEQWLDRTGAPVLSHDWRAEEGGVTVEITQHQPGEPFDLWLDLVLERDGAGPLERRVRVSERVAELRFEDLVSVRAVRLDPDHQVLRWDPTYGPLTMEGAPTQELDPVDEASAERYAGTYDLPAIGARLEIRLDDGQLIVDLRGRRQVLVHTGGQRFRTDDGYVVFDVERDRAAGLTFFHESGGTRRALRAE